MSSLKRRQNYNSGFDNLGFKKKLDEPQLMRFMFEDRFGVQKKSYDKSWDIDDHIIPLAELFRRYGTDPVLGLNVERVKQNLSIFGQNKLFPPKKQSNFVKFLKNVLMGLNLLLWISGVISIITFFAQFITNGSDDDVSYDNLTSGLVLFTVVLIAACFSFYQEYQSVKILDSFKNMIPQFTIVWREGVRREIEVESLVVGDLIEVTYGDRLPADIRIIDSSSFKVDNSGLTGEAEPQKRNKNFTDKDPMETHNLAFFSTSVVEGSATGIVIRVGENTFMGKLASLAAKVKAKNTPLGQEMNRIIIIMTILSLSFGVFFFGIGLSMKYSLVDTLFFVIGIVIANIPENLNVALTIVLALIAKKLASKNCLVKNLHAVETLGSTSVICTDKTGTITQSKMSVAHLWFNNDIAEADTSEFATSGLKYEIDNPGLMPLCAVSMLCSNAKFIENDTEVPIQRRKIRGDASETALLRFMELQFGNVAQFSQGYPKVFEIPFNSKNKYQVSIHEMEQDGKKRLFLAMKGAPEKIISMCKTILIKEIESDMNEEWIFRINEAYTNLASQGERVLGFCDLMLPSDKYQPGHVFDSDNPDFMSLGFRFVGLISMIDPPRATVPFAVEKCRAAGIKIVMLTGDHPLTAKAIAKAVGIITPEKGKQTKSRDKYCSEKTIELCLNEFIENSKSVVVIGSELANFTQFELDNLLANYEEIVFARISPEQKYHIVEGFQRLGHVVAVTGDGVNDSPALKKADIGIAMGITGTDVAKEVADLILLDDNFATLVSGVEHGRLIYDNLKKLIRFTFADNIAEMYFYWIFIILRIPLPMGTLQMLLLTSIMDMAPAVSLAHEEAESDIMKLRPRDRKKDKLITAQVLSFSYGQVSIIELCGGFFSYYVTYGYNGWLPMSLMNTADSWDSDAVNDLMDSYGQEWSKYSRMRLESQAQTAFFAALFLCQLFNAVTCKSRRLSIFQQGFKNHALNFSLILNITIACTFIYVPGCNALVNLTPIRWEIWISCLPFAVLLIVYDEIRKLIARKLPNSWFAKEFNV